MTKKYILGYYDYWDENIVSRSAFIVTEMSLIRMKGNEKCGGFPLLLL